MHEGNVCKGDLFPDGITNGAEWYDVPGNEIPVFVVSPTLYLFF